MNEIQWRLNEIQLDMNQIQWRMEQIQLDFIQPQFLLNRKEFFLAHKLAFFGESDENPHVVDFKPTFRRFPIKIFIEKRRYLFSEKFTYERKARKGRETLKSRTEKCHQKSKPNPTVYFRSTPPEIICRGC
jgi:hypothetical protein